MRLVHVVFFLRLKNYNSYTFDRTKQAVTMARAINNILTSSSLERPYNRFDSAGSGVMNYISLSLWYENYCRSLNLCRHYADLATERELQLTTARANQTTGLTNGRAANWAPEVVFSPFPALSCRQLTFPSCF